MKKIIIIAVVVVVLIVGGLAAFFLVFNSDDGEKEIIYEEYELGEMYSNIATENKIAKFNVVIEYTDPETLPKITNNKTAIMNNIYEIFRVQNFEDIQKPTGQQRLRERIQQMVIETLESDNDTISNIYFTEFIIQG
jgi:flagellar FliL protein